MSTTVRPTTSIEADSELVPRRRFTTEGVHPYDEVVWELRDAVI